MQVNIQLIVDSISNMFIIAFPFSLLLILTKTLVNYFVSMVFGRKVDL